MAEERREQRRARERHRARRQRLLLAAALLALVLLTVVLLSRCGKKDSPEPPADNPAETDVTPELPAGWERRAAAPSELREAALMLVNREHGYDASLQPTVSVLEKKTDSYLVRDRTVALRRDAMEALNRWLDDFAAATGKADVNVVAGWRSYEDQEALYRNAVAEQGQAYADAYLALPGCSEHHTGLAVDLDTYDEWTGVSGGFDGGGSYTWAVDHAWEYGFVQRYPLDKVAITGIDYESWHFRYVGLPHAYVMHRDNLCLEEYIDYLQGHTFSSEHLRVSCLGRSYEIYTCPADDLILPSDDPCTVSPDNVSGFVVTVDRTPSAG